MTRLTITLICLSILALITGCKTVNPEPVDQGWPPHSMSRPQPPVVEPGKSCGDAPADAIVLFDGTDLSQWVSVNTGGPAQWKVENGYMEVIRKTGYIQTKKKFGDCQLHIEWMAPAEPRGGQNRGNSGVFLMLNYEVQILDSYKSPTYADGRAASMYGQQPPDFKASRAPGKWQSYDIIFHGPVFKGKELVKPATITMFHNGVVVHDNYQIKGFTLHKKTPVYRPHPDKLPIKLQDHGAPVRFRNIWIRDL